jgi:hypothetical protein
MDPVINEPAMERAEKINAWIEIHQRWVIAGVVLLLFGLLSAAGIGLVSVVHGAMRSTDIYKMSWDRVAADERVAGALAGPLGPGWSIGGDIKLQGADGSAAFQYSIAGTKTHGVVYVKATKTAGEWTFQDLHVVLADGRKIILEPSP